MNIFIDDGGVAVNPDATAIYDDLVAYWDFEENDGTSSFLDSFASNDVGLVSSGTSTTAAKSDASGLIARRFASSDSDWTARIPRANTALDLGDVDWTYWTWLKCNSTTLGSTRFVMGRPGSNSGSNLNHGLRLSGVTETLDFFVSSTGSGVSANADSGVAPSASNWTLIACTLDRVNDEIVIRARAVGAGSITKVSTAFPGALYTGSNDANFCINDAIAGDSTFFSGDRAVVSGGYDAAGVALKALTDAEFNVLFNGGVGLSFSQLQALAGY